MCKWTVFTQEPSDKRSPSGVSVRSDLGLLTVNRLTGYPVLRGWTGYKLSCPRNRSDLALIVQLRLQVCRRHKVTSDDLDHTHTHYILLRPTSVEWVDHTLCGPHTAAPRLPLSVCLSVSLSPTPGQCDHSHSQRVVLMSATHHDDAADGGEEGVDVTRNCDHPINRIERK